MTNPQATNPPVVAILEFQGTQLITIQKDQHNFVAMKSVVEGIGLAWQSQREKLQDNKEKFSCNDIVSTGKDGKQYKMLCMPITKLNGWLFSINPNKIPNIKTREKVVSYQEECFIALYDYWHKGIAERKTPLLPETLIPSEQHELFEKVKAKASAFEDVGKARAEIWSRIHRKFKVAKYDQLPRIQLHDALEYVEQMEVGGVKTIAPQALDNKYEVGLLKIRIEELEFKNKFLSQHNDCLKMEVETLRLVMESSREMAKEAFAMMRELTGGFVLKARTA